MKTLDELVKVVWAFRTSSWWINDKGEFADAGEGTRRIGCWCDTNQTVDRTDTKYTHSDRCLKTREVMNKCL